MGRPKGRPNRPPAELPAEEISQEVPTEDEAVTEFNAEHAEPNAPISDKSVNQADLVRQAVAAGHEKPSAGVAYIKAKFGADIDPKYYSVAKSQMKKREGAEPEKPPTPRQPSKTAAPRPAMPGIIPSGLFDDLKQMRQIKDKYGADEFAKLVEFLG